MDGEDRDSVAYRKYELLSAQPKFLWTIFFLLLTATHLQ